MENAPCPQQDASKPLVVILSGTHVTGKETVAIHLSNSLGCPWLKADNFQGVAHFGARSQVSRGFNYSDVFGRIWFAKLRRVGFSPPSPHQFEAPKQNREACAALITGHAMRKPARVAIRNVLAEHSIRPIFVMMQIPPETLPGRTLGAEEAELAKRILGEKLADNEPPSEGESDDTILLNSLRDVSTLVTVILEELRQRFNITVDGPRI